MTFEDAVHTFTAVESDDGISSAASSNFIVNVNPTAPTITSQVGTATQGGALELVGTGEAGNIVTLTIGGVTVGTGVVDATGHFDIITVSGLNPGVQQVTATETDAALLTSAASSFITTVAPAAPLITSVISVDDPGGRVEVFGTGAAGDIVRLYADGNPVAIGSGTVDPTGHFAIYSTMGVAIGAGGHGITVTQTLVNPLGAATSAASPTTNVTVATVANTFTITTAADLAAAIALIDLGGTYSQVNTHYTFNITGDLTLGSQLPAFNLAAGDTLTIHGNGATLDAHGNPGLFVYSGAVEIDHLSIINATSTGGGSDGGGGGAGLGGGLFIASGGAVTLDSVTFAHDRAVGGTSGYYTGRAFGGGGMGGLGRDQEVADSASGGGRFYAYVAEAARAGIVLGAAPAVAPLAGPAVVVVVGSSDFNYGSPASAGGAAADRRRRRHQLRRWRGWFAAAVAPVWFT